MEAVCQELPGLSATNYVASGGSSEWAVDFRAHTSRTGGFAASRFALVAIVSGLAGIVMHVYAPEAISIGQVVHHHKSITAD